MNIHALLFGQPLPTVSAREASAQLQSKRPPLLLDVREPSEFRSGRIPGATSIPLGKLQGRLKELPRDYQIICVCQSGSRSSSATRQLLEAGYLATNLQGGMLAWRIAGLPVTKGD